MTETHAEMRPDARTDLRLGGAAMIAAALAGVLTMAVHPASRDMFVPGAFGTVAAIGVAAHILGIISTPIAFLGALVMARYLDARNRIAMTALAIYAMALVAIMIAPTLSGLVAIPILQKIVDHQEPAAQWNELAIYTGMLNQAFARIFTLLASIAIALWSIPIVKTDKLPRGIGIYGLILAPVMFIAVATGHLQLGVHGFGAVVLFQGIWLVAAGVSLYRAAGPPGEFDPT